MSKYKKMSLKEFKEALEKADISLDFWGYEGILLFISIAHRDEAIQQHKLGLNTISDKSHRTADIISEILDNRGYFDNLDS